MQRCFHNLIGAVALVASMATIATAAPVPGLYRSTDLGGALLTGRASQSWSAAANAANGLGDVFHAQSWNGALGTQWNIRCGVQGAVQTVNDYRFLGTGDVEFRNVFSGGTFNFVNGPWCTTANCTGVLGATRENVTVTYVSNVPVESRVNISTNGLFDASSCALTFAVANGVGGGDTDALAFPAGYPSLLDTSCNPTRTNGSWGDVITISARIDCAVPTRSATWGTLKSLYR